MDPTRQANEVRADEKHTMSYAWKKDQNVDNNSFDKEHRQSLAGSRSPKTDYTYAKSISYNSMYSDKYTRPNMSRPSIRDHHHQDTQHPHHHHQLDDSLSSISQSDITDTSTPKVKYDLRSRRVMESTSKGAHEPEGASPVDRAVPTIPTGGSATRGVHSNDRINLQYIYGTDRVSSTRNGVKENGALKMILSAAMAPLVLIWTVVSAPIAFLARKLRGERIRTKKLRIPDPRNHSGGIFYVFRNSMTYLFGTFMKSSEAIDRSVLSRTSKIRDCHICCLPLVFLLTAAILGGGYLYACGDYPTPDLVYGYRDAALEMANEYAVYGLEAYGHAWSYLKSLSVYFEHAPKFEEEESDATPLPPPPSGGAENPELPVKPRSGTEGSPLPSAQSKEFDGNPEHLRKSLEEFIDKRWNLYEAQAKKREGDLMALEDLKRDFIGFKSDLYKKVAQLEELLRRERSDERSDPDKTAEDSERTRAEVKESMDRLREELRGEMERRNAETESVVTSRVERMMEEQQLKQEDEERRKGTVDVEARVDTSVESKLVEIFSSRDSKLGRVLMSWLSEEFVSGTELERRMESVESQAVGQRKVESLVSDETKSLREEMKKLMDAMETKLQGRIEEAEGRGRSSLAPAGSSVAVEEVQRAIKEALSKYDADKTGKTDFALESGGGSVVGIRCSKTYKRGMAQLSVFGIPLWYANNSPRTVIQPGSLPGECWPFVGSEGHVVVQLSTRIHVREVSLEHVDVRITIFGNVDSAPREFSVLGLADANDLEGTNLGNFTYDANSETIQFFHIAPELQTLSFLHVELRVHSNHGNPEYTCLYRFRVHGTPEERTDAGRDRRGETAEK